MRGGTGEERLDFFFELREEDVLNELVEERREAAGGLAGRFGGHDGRNAFELECESGMDEHRDVERVGFDEKAVAGTGEGFATASTPAGGGAADGRDDCAKGR